MNRFALLVAGFALGTVGLYQTASAVTSDARAGAAADASARSLTFNKDVAPVVFNNCVNCHRPGEVAPFALTSYKEVKKHASQIADVTESHYMPPWKPEAGHGDFIGERRLTEPQIALFRDWVKQGAPEGNASDLPPLPKFPSGWQLGEPDVVVKMTEPYSLRAEGRDDFHVFVIPLNLKEDTYVSAVEFRPSNPKIVHHALLFLDNTGTARKLDEQDAGPGYSRAGGVGFLPVGGLGGWVPGLTPRHLPEGVGREIKKGSDLVVQVHFHPSGKVEKEQSTIGLYLSKKTPEKVLFSFMKPAIRALNIAPGDKNYVVDDTMTLPAPVTLIGITPHAHLLCKEIKVDATLPDGTEKPLCWIKDWDWSWQDEYHYQSAFTLPAGTKIKMHYVYDNSTDNLKNPTSPPKRAHWGEQTSDEMAITFFQLEVDRGVNPLASLLGVGGKAGGMREAIAGGKAGATTKPSAVGPEGLLGDLDPDSPIMQFIIKRFDKNKNGKLDPDELETAREELRKQFGAGGAGAGAGRKKANPPE